MAKNKPFDYVALHAEYCPCCRHNGSAACSYCSFDQGFPTLWAKKPETRYDLIMTLDTDELAAYLELELGDGLPVGWLAWLTEDVT